LSETVTNVEEKEEEIVTAEKEVEAEVENSSTNETSTEPSEETKT